MTQPLAILLTELRAELRAETWSATRMHYGTNGGRSTKGEPADEMGGSDPQPQPRSAPRGVGWTGLPYTPQFERLLGSPDGWGTAYLARASIQEVSDRCHARHRPNHERPGDRYGLCARLVFRVVELGQPVSFAAERMGLEPEVAESTLQTALAYAAEWRSKRLDDLRHAAIVEKSAEVTVQESIRADHENTEWERQKWEGIREGHHLPPWEIEWERRLVWHAKYNCRMCERVAA